MDLPFFHQNGVLFMDVGGPELLLILAVILVLFGGQKISELSKGLRVSRSSKKRRPTSSRSFTR
ncbi:twin-arginine translocase TatA/TatE family subunit [Chlorobaculum sp. 24CR]|uniref:twin-arginine translocase TatA/TatE family subunit n=1 Tax=Chlorobaculum sp. 24CR TaxID=2508878 RepID=UPI003529FCB4